MKLFTDKDSSRVRLLLWAGCVGFYFLKRVRRWLGVSFAKLFPAWLILVYISRLHLACRQCTRGHCFARATVKRAVTTESIVLERRADRGGSIFLQLENRSIRSKYRILREYWSGIIELYLLFSYLIYQFNHLYINRIDTDDTNKNNCRITTFVGRISHNNSLLVLSVIKEHII